MLIEKGAIGDGNKAAENGENAGYFQFENSENNTGFAMQNAPRVQRKTYSKSISKDRPQE